MRIVPLADIQSAITAKAAIEAVKAGFIAHARGQVHCPEPVQIVFRDDRQEQHGECHVKSAIWSGRPYAAVKIASGSYRNAARGLPGAGGMIVLIATDTGLPEAILHDECWLTNVRTAAAGALAAGLKPVSKDATLGVIGTGTQAEIQATMICSHLGLGSVSVWGRSAAKAAALSEKLKAGGLAATAMDTVRDVCHSSADCRHHHPRDGTGRSSGRRSRHAPHRRRRRRHPGEDRAGSAHPANGPHHRHRRPSGVSASQ